MGDRSHNIRVGTKHHGGKLQYLEPEGDNDLVRLTSGGKLLHLKRDVNAMKTLGIKSEMGRFL